MTSEAVRRPALSEAWRFGERNLFAAITILCLLGGSLAAIAVLMLTNKPDTFERVGAGLIGTFAGALIGTSITILVDRRLQRGPLSQMVMILEDTLSSTMRSAERDLAGLRTRWHHYHLTVIKGQPKWRYEMFEFAGDASIGSLSTTVTSIDPDGESHEYRIEAAVRGARLIVTHTPLRGREAPVVEIFPHMLYEFTGVHAGVGIIQTWDRDEVLTPTLFSHTPLCDISEPGFVDTELAACLNDYWNDAFGDLGRLLRPIEAHGLRGGADGR
jgi:hypothetical protein